MEPSWREEDEAGMKCQFQFCDGSLTECSNAAILWCLAQTPRRHFGAQRVGTSDGIRGYGRWFYKENNGVQRHSHPWML